jgi:hypothetical protein
MVATNAPVRGHTHVARPSQTLALAERLAADVAEVRKRLAG